MSSSEKSQSTHLNSEEAHSCCTEPHANGGQIESSWEERLAKAQAEAAEHKDAWLRALAEAENIRRRAQADLANAHKFAIERFAENLLPVKDSLEQTLQVEGASWETLKNGVELTLKNIVSAFERAGVVELNPVGEKFDPNRHQAMSSLPSEQAANTVLQVFQKGYLLNERVLRPALVAVSKAKED